MSTVLPSSSETITTDVPARIDRLPWGRWHWRVVIALGITWIIDGLEVTLVGAIGGVLGQKETLHLSEGQIGLLGTSYLIGAVLGSLVFGYLTDRLGRKPLFTVTLGLYLGAAFCTAFSWDFWSFAVFRFLTGAGIGGEYSAINSAIDELIPARVRGRVDLRINGSYWIGAAAGSLASLLLLDTDIFPVNLGWRLGFGIGALLGLIIIFYRNHVPESPRWLATHGRGDEANRVVEEIERHFTEDGVKLEPVHESITLHARHDVGFGLIARTMVHTYPGRTLLGLSLMISQAFLYNAVFFTYALVLVRFYDVPSAETGLYLLPFALGNFLGPVLLGHFFDTVGRKPMIAGTYTISAILLAATGWLFTQDLLTATTQTLLWSVIFFFASAASSSAYLTVSEVFPLEMRGLAIALFFAVGTTIGGSAAPALFGYLIGTNDRFNLFYGYLLASALLAIAVIATILFGVKAEGASLESVADPLSKVADSPKA
ncbi:MFS transporter [Tundrisphaera lichenicola]|uniref:MFS transporter n=1 Tax=Tundrisphaera lichenicola TaxID=2029860 RepID=UPI003EC018A4